VESLLEGLELNDTRERWQTPMVRRTHILPENLVLHCLQCGVDTSFSVDALVGDEDTPPLDSPLLCQGCGNDVDARIERDLRRIAEATVSIRTFLPAADLPHLPRREKTWNVRVETRAIMPG